jgi:isopenicillin N synthase-like dioxygenase
VIPVIDFGTADRRAQAAAIDAALCEVGFFTITGHGVPAAVQAAAFEAGHRFFALAESHKRRWHIDGWPPADGPPQGRRTPSAGERPQGVQGAPLKRGFDPIGWQSLDPGQPPDVKESFYLGEVAHGPNQWPDPALLPGFRVAMETYAAAMQTLARRLMSLYEVALGLPAGHFDGFMHNPICTTRLLHYPPQPAQAAPGQIGCGAHTDWGALTLLAQDDAGGLQVQTTAGDWIDVPPLAGALVVNVGDLMQRWTNDRWVSTPHRVINRLSGRDRWSIAYFFDLDGDAAIEPLAACVSAERPARYAPITAAEHLAEMYRRTTVAA